MQMVFCYYLVAWNEGLPKAAPLLWRCDLIFSAVKQTASLPLIHLAGGEFGLRQAGQPTDLWVKSVAALGRQPVWANDGARMTEAIGLWLADMAAGFCKLSYSWAWVGKGAERLKWEWMYWSCCRYENDTRKLIFTGGGTHCWRRQTVCDVDKLLKSRWRKWMEERCIPDLKE